MDEFVLHHVCTSMLATLVLLSIVLGPEAQSQPLQTISGDCATVALAPLGQMTFVAVPAIHEGKAGITAILINSQLTETRSVFFPLDAQPACMTAATSGEDVIVVWTGDDRVLHALLLKPDLEIAQGPIRIISAPYGQRIGTAWQRGAGTYLVVAGSSYVEIHRSDIRTHHVVSVTPWTFRDIVHGPLHKTVTFDAVATSDTTSAITALGFVPAQTACNFARPGCASFSDAWSVAVARPHPITPVELESRTIDPIGQTTVALAGERALTGWIRQQSRLNPRFDLVARWVDQGTVFDVRRGQPFIANLASASDGEHVIMVWEEDFFPTKRIAGALIDRDGLRESFIVAESAATPRKPSVIALEPGRFLVAYELTETGNTSRLAGRVVHVDPPHRRRAVR